MTNQSVSVSVTDKMWESLSRGSITCGHSDQVNLYWAQLPARMLLDDIDIRSMKDWCLDRFGIDHELTWYYTHFRFYFKEKEHLMLFLLRWT